VYILNKILEFRNQVFVISLNSTMFNVLEAIPITQLLGIEIEIYD